jgi:hypothetical protein
LPYTNKSRFGQNPNRIRVLTIFIITYSFMTWQCSKTAEGKVGINKAMYKNPFIFSLE